MLLEVLLAGGDQLDGDELIAAALEAGEDGADETALDAVRLDGDEAGKGISTSVSVVWLRCDSDMRTSARWTLRRLLVPFVVLGGRLSNVLCLLR